MSTVQKAIIYCRVSSRSQETDGHGLESQETRCRQYAEAKGYEVVVVFPDTITGGGDFMKRPGMVALLSFLDAQPDEKFIVVFDDLKRASRDTRAFLDLRDAFRKRNTRVECLNFKFDDTPEGEFIETIIAAQGALERKQNGRQVAQKMKARMQTGYWVHNPPIGYRYIKVQGRGRMLEPNPPFDAIIKEAFEGYASGRFQTQAEVKRFLESFPHFPRSKHGDVKQHRVTEILTQPVYTGHICSETYGIQWLKAQHQPLVALETYDKVQERRKGTAKAPKRANIGDAFALRGIALCACCEAPLRSSFPRGRSGKRYPYYLCQTKGCNDYGKSIKRDQLEGDVGALIETLQPTQDVIILATAMFRQVWDARCKQASEIVQSGKNRITAIDREIDKLLDLIMSSNNATVIQKYEEKITQFERNKAITSEKLANQTEPKGSFEEKLEPALSFLSSPWNLWKNGNTATRRLIASLCFGERIRYCRNEGARTPTLSFPLRALQAGSDPQVCFGGVGET